MKTVKSKKIDYELFHLSFKDDLEGKWEPILPAGSEIEDKENKYPEPKIERISFSPTIELCWRAIYLNIKQYFEEYNYPHMDMHIYSPIFKGREEIVLPETLTEDKLVWDAWLTQEHWSLDSVEMKRVGKVRFFNSESNVENVCIFRDCRKYGDREHSPEVTPIRILSKENRTTLSKEQGKELKSLKW